MVSFKLNRPTYPGASATPSRSPRRRVLLSGMFQSLTHSWPVSIRNLSCTGAAIALDAALAEDMEGVLVIAGHLDCLCRVVWSRGKLHGLSFDRPLHNAVVLDLHRVTRDQVQAAEKEAAKEWWQHNAN